MLIAKIVLIIDSAAKEESDERSKRGGRRSGQPRTKEMPSNGLLRWPKFRNIKNAIKRLRQRQGLCVELDLAMTSAKFNFLISYRHTLNKDRCHV